MESEQWYSPRRTAEDLRREKVQVFDALIDLALDGVITMEQAIIGCKEVLATAEAVEAA